MSSASRSAASFSSACDEEAGKKATVVAGAHRRRLPDARGVAQHLLGLVELSGMAVRQREQGRVVRVVPIVVALNLFGFVVVVFELSRTQEDVDRILHAPDLHQIVAVHVQRVRNV